jgi:hypothetical protein
MTPLKLLSRAIIVLPFCAILAIMASAGAVLPADQAASSNSVQVGLQNLTLQSPAGLISADTNFALALQKNPTNSQALVLKTGTELFVLQQSPQFITLLTQVGVMQPNGNIYGYDYQLPVDMDGNLAVATNSRTEQILSYGTNTLRPALDQAIGRLEMVSTNLRFTLTADETSTEPTAVDYGDVKGVLSILYLIKSAIHALDSYNLSVALPDFVKLIQGASTIQDILNSYPSLFSSNTNIAQRALAKEAFSKQIPRIRRHPVISATSVSSSRHTGISFHLIHPARRHLLPNR